MTILNHPLKAKISLLGVLLAALLVVPTSYALPPDQSDDLQVTAQVPSDHPIVEATITSPTNGTVTSNAVIAVKGTCEPNAYVTIKTNGVLAGSAYCTAGGTYSIQIQLSPGKNVLTALNFDGLGVPGPATPSVDVTFQTLPGSPPPATPPPLPEYPKTCRDYTPPSASVTGRVRVALVCAPELIEPGKTYKIGIFIWGGEGPYAVSVDWGIEGAKPSLYSFKDVGYHELKFSYKESGSYVVGISVSDQSDYEGFAQAALIVSGEGGLPEVVDKTPRVNTSWFYSSVPLYLVLGALVVGFWPGYLLGRRVLRNHKTKKIAKTPFV